MNLADCYRVLELGQGATVQDIKSSYRRLARQYHPDTNVQDRQASEKFIQVAAAYKVLLSQVAQKPPATVAASPSYSSPESRVTVKRQTSPPQATSQEPTLSLRDRQLKASSYRELQTFLKAKQFPQAIALAEALAQRFPTDLEVRQWQAIAYHQWGRFLVGKKQLDKARAYLKKALRTDPHNRSLWSEVERDFQRMEKIF